MQLFYEDYDLFIENLRLVVLQIDLMQFVVDRNHVCKSISGLASVAVQLLAAVLAVWCIFWFLQSEVLLLFLLFCWFGSTGLGCWWGVNSAEGCEAGVCVQSCSMYRSASSFLSVFGGVF
jgi:hypothetical protein